MSGHPDPFPPGRLERLVFAVTLGLWTAGTAFMVLALIVAIATAIDRDFFGGLCP